MDINELKVGDTLVSSNAFYRTEIATIVRETPTQWVLSNNTRVYKKNLNCIGSYRSYRIVSEEELKHIKHQIFVARVRQMLPRYDWEHLPEDKLMQVYSIISTKDQNKKTITL